MLILRNPYYTNTLNPNKTLYYESLSKKIYHYYTENTFILSNLTNHFNILTKKHFEYFSLCKIPSSGESKKL